MVKQPWMKFYPSDWRADPALRMCEPLSRYVWLEMLGIMHEADPYGHLMVNGIAVTDEALARLIDVPLKAVRSSLKELGRNGVYSVTDHGIILSRRMVRDEMKARSNRDNGMRGGNPSLRNQGVSQGSVNPSDKGQVKAQIPDTRSQSEKRETNVSPKKGTRIADDWEPSEADRQFATDLGMSSQAVQFEADKFKDFWISKSGGSATKQDWAATWRYWIRNNRAKTTGPPRKTAFQLHNEAVDRELDKVINGKHDNDDGASSNIIDLAAADYRHR